MTPWQADINEWHKRMTFPSGDYSNPQPLTGKVLAGRTKWIDGETDELLTAMNANDVAEIVDALIDIAYFVLGSFDVAGMIAHGRYWEIIQTGNYRNSQPLSPRSVSMQKATAKMARELTAAMWREHNRAWSFQRFEMMDALLKQVAHTFTAMRIDPRPHFDEVQVSNDSKYPPVFGEDGKLQKGPNYRPPDIAGVLRAQGVL